MTYLRRMRQSPIWGVEGKCRQPDCVIATQPTHVAWLADGNVRTTGGASEAKSVTSMELPYSCVPCKGRQRSPAIPIYIGIYIGLLLLSE
ncbi:MAG: hypothetical protein JWO42_1092 [Chloroflexi bacterium]|nr:hypothetical protein [Chloroflexota bacterium]